MALDANIRGATTGLGAEVNASNQLKVVLETAVATNPGNVGAVRFFSENDPGTITGNPYLQSPETSDDYRLRVGMDTLAFDHTFTETVIDTSRWKVPIAPVGTPAAPTAALSGGFLTLNNTGTTTSSGAHITWQGQRYFRIRNTSPLYVEFTGNLTAVPITNQVFEIGLFIPTGTTAPADGVWFQVTSAGVIGVINYNGTVTQTGVLVAPAQLPIAQNGTYLILVNSGYVEFWIDDVLYGEVNVPAGQATPFLTDALPIGIQYRHSGTVAGTGQAAIRIGDVGVTVGDIMQNRTWPAQMGGMGCHASQGQSGGTMGTTASLPNATAATTVTGTALSQTVTIKTGLGGEAGITAAVPGLDGYVFAYQNPTGSVTQPPRNLTIYGVRISALNIGAAVATTPTTVQWSLAYGGLLVGSPGLGATDSILTTGVTTKSYRRIPLGFSSFLVGALVGQQAPDITYNFTCPITVTPGEVVAIVAKFIQGTATASQVVWCTAAFDAHFD